MLDIDYAERERDDSYTDAITHLTQSLGSPSYMSQRKTNPDDAALIHLHRGYVYAKLERYRDANADFRQCQSIARSYSDPGWLQQLTLDVLNTIR